MMSIKSPFVVKIYHWLSLLATVSWVLAGLIIAGSIYLSPESYVIHLVVGTVMFLIGLLVFFRSGSLKQLTQAVSESAGENQEHNLSQLMHKYLLWDLLLVLLSLFVGSILAYLALYRVFVEKMAVFG